MCMCVCVWVGVGVCGCGCVYFSQLNQKLFFKVSRWKKHWKDQQNGNMGKKEWQQIFSRLKCMIGNPIFKSFFLWYQFFLPLSLSLTRFFFRFFCRSNQQRKCIKMNYINQINLVDFIRYRFSRFCFKCSFRV